jgi:hypothetical protein
MSDDAGFFRVARELGQYLVDHPNAKDTIEGIRRWWLVEGEQRFRYEEVEAVVRFMVQRGFMSRDRIGNTVVYGCAEGGPEKIHDWIREMSSE